MIAHYLWSKAARHLALLFALACVPTGRTALASATTGGASRTPSLLLLVQNPPSHGLIAAHLDLTAAARQSKALPVIPEAIQALSNGQRLPVQFIPDPDFDSRSRVAGTLLLRYPRATPGRVHLLLGSRGSVKNGGQVWDGTVKTPHVVVTHDARRLGGLPSQLRFTASDKLLQGLEWNDRLHHRERGSFFLRHDPQARVRRISAGELCTVVRTRAHFMTAAGKRPASEPIATYDWYYFHSLPLVWVRATIRQREEATWHEHHFLELNLPGGGFSGWAGGEALRQGEFTGAKKVHSFGSWGALIEEKHAIALLNSGQILVYDGRGSYGTYLHAYGEAAFRPWEQIERQFSAWLWLGSDPEPVAAIRAALSRLPEEGGITATMPTVQTQIDQLRARAARLSGVSRQDALWRAPTAARLQGRGRFSDALKLTSLASSGALQLRAGDLGLRFERTGGGLRLQSLFDLAVNRELLDGNPPPFYSVTLRDAKTKEMVSVRADAGWRHVLLEPAPGKLTIRWQQHVEPKLQGVQVTAQATTDPKASGVRWSLKVENDNPGWSVWRVVFPQLGLAEPGVRPCLLLPHGPGEVRKGAWQSFFRYRGTYPNGFRATMPFMAIYDDGPEGKPKTGLYIGLHDARGSTKDLFVESRAGARAMLLGFDHPAPDMGRPGNRFILAGDAVWQFLRGDWFDAAMIYKAWTQRAPGWLPTRGTDGRVDTPLWMRELCAWTLAFGPPEKSVRAVKEFAQFMGVPVGLHWYNWHQIPFDNDYPHYFPAHPGFTEGVADLQKAGVFVMPYINGRLWDTRDRGLEDASFSKVALPAAAKDESGAPYCESYSSKETDGTPVRLGVMCSATRLWQEKVNEIVLRLFNECKLDAVYLDQVAATSPPLCFDPSHGHPLGGGDWWREGYRKMLEACRSTMPPGRVLTSECNADAYVRQFDGFLTWHWQHDGQVPAFPAVYGGAIQMFGRAYRGGSTKEQALRMKAGQQLVFGEQIGWIEPGVLRERQNAAFLREIVRLRWETRRYFYAGEMARPPKLADAPGKIEADWQWSGKWPVTTDAVLTGAWRLPQEDRLLLLFVNVGDEAIRTTLNFDGRAYDLQGRHLRLTTVTAEGRNETITLAPSFRRQLALPGRTAVGWEIAGVR